MTIRFRGAYGARSPRLAPLQTPATILRPANDNAAGLDLMLHAALRHFAEHGLAAAQRARRQAEAAFFAGDRQGYQWWLEICRALDRRMARELTARTGGGA